MDCGCDVGVVFSFEAAKCKGEGEEFVDEGREPVFDRPGGMKDGGFPSRLMSL